MTDLLNFAPPASPCARRVGSLLLLLAFSCVAQAQTQPSNQPQPEGGTLRIRSREVVLDVVVTRRGVPVTNLKKEDFKITEDKADQRILSFSRPEDHLPAPGAPPVTSSADLLKAGNIPINLIILDELNTAFEDTAYGRSQTERYLERQPPITKEPIAILSISDSGLKVIADYTQNRDVLYNAVKKHFPVYPFRKMKGGDSGPDAGERLARCLGSLLTISQSVKGYQGRKTIVWIGRGFPGLDTDSVNADKAAEALAATQLVTTSLLESRTVLNIVDPTPLAVSQVDFTDSETVSSQTLLSAEGANGTSLFPGDIDFAAFAPATGGLAFFAHNDIDKEIATSIDDGADYYSLSYSPTNKSDDPAKFRQIVVTTSDPTVEIWTRTGYYLAHQVKPGEKQAAPTTRQLQFDLTTAALSAIPYSGLRVTAERAGDKVKVSVQPLGLELRASKSGVNQAEITYMEVALGPKNKVLASHVDEVTQLVTQDVEPVVFEIPSATQRGATRTRIVIRDAASGRIGTADLPD